MFNQFGATADTLSKASTMVFRIGTDAHLYDDPEDVRIAPLLDSKYDSEKCEALKRLLALIAQGFDVSNFFPQVVKNVASQSAEVKKLVYLYLLHYAEKRPSEALLTINYFKKDLGDPNPLVRACALRAMAGIRLHSIAPLVLDAVAKCARDPSVYVRKCAANALPKLYDLRLEEHTPALEEIVGILLNDHSPGVVGATSSVFASICPNNLALIGKNYRRLCESLPDVEEWGQISLIWILLRYVIARHGLVKESIMYSLHNNAEGYHSDSDASDKKVTAEGNISDTIRQISMCYIEGPDEYLSRSSYGNEIFSKLDHESFILGKNNDDVRILLQCTLPLLWNQNSAVVLAAASVHWIMAPVHDVAKIVKPLLFVLRSSRDSKYVVLCNIQVMAKTIPSLFASHYEEFYISSSDSYQIKTLKLGILSSIATDTSISFIFQEFQDYIRDQDRRFAADTVAAIGLCAQRLPKVANTCLEGLLALTRQELLTNDSGLENEEDDVLIQAIMSIKAIVKQDPPSHEKVIIQLVRRLDSIKIPAARAVIIWMVGEYSFMGEIIPKMLKTVFLYLALCFVSEACVTKLQILNTSIKVLVSHGKLPEKDIRTFKIVSTYLLELAECDLNYDVRDRARFIKQLMSRHLMLQGLEEEQSEKNDMPLKLVEHMFTGKIKPTSPEPINYRYYLPGSLSQIVCHAAPEYSPLPKPCYLLGGDLSKQSALNQGDSDDDDDSHDTLSGSPNEENTSGYSSEQSVSTSNGSESDTHVNSGPLINLGFDIGTASTSQNEVSQQDSDGLENLMSKKSLESWLDEKLDLTKSAKSKENMVRKSSANISIGDLSGRVKTKIHSLIDPAIGNGLKVNYSFSSEISSISSLLICVEVFFENCSTETMTNIYLADEKTDKNLDSSNQSTDLTQSSTSHSDIPTLVPIEEISSLEPGQTTKRIIHVRFHHHLMAVNLFLWCNDKKLPVKLWPDIGYFVKPLSMDMKAFMSKESQLEYTRSCTFTDHIEELNNDKKDKFVAICEALAIKMLSNANLYLVSVDMPVASKLDDASGLCLRFSCEILSTPVACLVTVVVEEGKCSEPLNVCVKVNCEETVFGLNLLNRVVKFLVEPSITRA